MPPCDPTSTSSRDHESQLFSPPTLLPQLHGCFGQMINQLSITVDIPTEKCDREVQTAPEEAPLVCVPPAHQPRQQVLGPGHRRALRASREGHTRASTYAVL